MNLPSDFPVTVFPHAADVTHGDHGTVAGVIAVVKSDRYAQQVRWIRSCKINGDSTAEDAKRQLPVIVWSGRFSSRANSACNEYTGLVVLDLDDLEDSAVVRDSLAGDPHIVCCFRSPGGDGCKPVIRTDAATPAEHRAAWLSACAYLLQKYQLTVSPGQGDVARACFASHDPDAWINADAVPLTIDRALIEAATVSQPATMAAGGKIARDRHPYLVAYCARLARAGLGQTEIEAAALVLVRDRFDLTDGRVFPAEEIRRAVQSATKFSGDDDAAAIVHGAQVAAALMAEASASSAIIAPEFDPAGSPAIPLRTHEDRMSACLNPPEEIIAGLLPVGGIGAIIAMPGQGKTLLSLELARCVAAGVPFAERETKQGQVVYLCSDAPASTERRMLGISDGAESIFSVTEAPLFPGGVATLFHALAALPDCRLVVLDTWDSSREHTGGGYAEIDGQIEGTMRALRALASERQLAVIVVHHATRGETTRARGSSVFDAKCDWIATVEQSDAGIVTLTTTKSRDSDQGQVGQWRIEAIAIPEAPETKPVPRLVPVGALEAAAKTGGVVVVRRDARRRAALRALAAVPVGQELTVREFCEVTGVAKGRGCLALIQELRAAGHLQNAVIALTEAGLKECKL